LKNEVDLRKKTSGIHSEIFNSLALFFPLERRPAFVLKILLSITLSEIQIIHLLSLQQVTLGKLSSRTTLSLGWLIGKRTSIINTSTCILTQLPISRPIPIETSTRRLGIWT